MGNIINKYRVHEVAKDFGLPTKTITEILTKYATTPKNHMQVLDDSELSLIFEYLTQHNQVSSMEVIFADAAKAEAPQSAQSAGKGPEEPRQQRPQPGHQGEGLRGDAPQRRPGFLGGVPPGKRPQQGAEIRGGRGRGGRFLGRLLLAAAQGLEHPLNLPHGLGV